MANKFSIAIKVKNGEISDTLFVFRKDAQRAIDTFKKWREEGSEAYLFQAPDADKRSVEAKVEQVADAPTSGIKALAAAVINGKRKAKEPKEAVSLDIE
jgi:hypothetical protein